MATTKVINVSTVDEDGKQTTFNLDNPKDDLTKAEVVSAFQVGIENSLLMSNQGTKIITVGTVAITTAEKIILEGEPVYITPNAINLATSTWYNEAQLSATVTVQNANIQAAQIANVQLAKGETVFTTNDYYQIINVNENVITVNFISRNEDTANSTGTANLVIIINGVTYNVPITFKQTA